MIRACGQCYEKQREVDRLKEEVDRLKKALQYRDRQKEDGFFGPSTPSSKIPFKPNVPEMKHPKKRGAQPGHPGHRRIGVQDLTGARIVRVQSAYGGRCPGCGGDLTCHKRRSRLVRESHPVESEDVVLELPVERCAACKKTYATKAPGVFPKSRLGTQLISNAVWMSYGHGIPTERVSEQLKVKPGVLMGSYHRLSDLLSDVPKKLKRHYQQAKVKHADETGWRTNGKNGYAWFFGTPTLSLFQFEATRSGEVAKQMLGKDALPGVLVVDRYAGYNQAPCEIQYCYAHLLREVKKLFTEFPEVCEVKTFVDTVAPLLSSAMRLRNQPISEEAWKKESAHVEQDLKTAMLSPAQHLGIRHIQDIFGKNETRLYHWARDRSIPAENNLAERDLRPTVIARKTSFGSQSERGAKTRGILMTVLQTLKKQGGNPSVQLKTTLDALARDPSQDPFPLLFPHLASPRE